MIPDTKRFLVLAGSVLLGACAANAETLTINVMDEQNRGVRSRVLYKTAPPPSVLGDTDNQGKLVRSHDCVAGQVFSARPFDIGSYFESFDEPCKADVILRVISRQTPKGMAVQFRIEPFIFTDGSPGIILYKGVVTTRASEILHENDARPSCSVEVNPIVEQKAFKIDNTSWKVVAGNEVSPSAIFAGPGWTQSKSVLLPYDCGTSRSRIQNLGANAATELSRGLIDPKLSVPNSMHTLGLQ
jgi:hypothetical protein